MTAATECPSLPRLSFSWPEGADFWALLTREWLVTNGRGGYASGTVPGCICAVAAASVPKGPWALGSGPAGP